MGRGRAWTTSGFVYVFVAVEDERSFRGWIFIIPWIILSIVRAVILIIILFNDSSLSLSIVRTSFVAIFVIPYLRT